MTLEDVSSRVNKLAAPVGVFESLTGQRSVIVQENTYSLIYAFRDETAMRIGQMGARLVDDIEVITLNAYHHINRAYFHASPGLAVIIAGIFKIVNLVVFIIKQITDTEFFRLMLTLHKLAVKLIPEYQKIWSNIMKSISDVSKAIGFGADGFITAMHAAMGTISWMSGAFGFEYGDFMAKTYDRYFYQADRISTWAHFFAKDPGGTLQSLFQQTQVNNYEDSRLWWKEVSGWIGDAIDYSQEAFVKIGEIAVEFEKFEKVLPGFIREHIPKELTEGVQRIAQYVDLTLLPAMQRFENNFNEVNAVLEAYRAKADNLADRLKYPGDLLLSVDDLPEYAKRNQLADIDDVTSRELASRAAAERLAMTADLNEFDIIREALTAPTPEPKFLGFESTERHAVTGIIVEPYETWFLKQDL